MADTVACLAAMKMLASTEPPIFLSPSQQLAGIARTASAEVFSSLVPSCPKLQLDCLLVDNGFDAEQIWQQIELLSSPLLSSLRRELKRLQREPPYMLSAPPKDEEDDHQDMQVEDGAEEAYEEEDDEEDKGKASEEPDDDDDDDEVEEEEKDADDESEEVKDVGVEDRFLKIKELEEYLEKDEAREYGTANRKGRKSALKDDESDNSEDLDDEDEDRGDFNSVDLEAAAVADDDDDDDDDDGEEVNDAEDARYEDFFGSEKKRGGQKAGDTNKRRWSEKVEVLRNLDGMGMDSEQGDDIQEDDDGDDKSKDDQFLSIHEKQLQNIQAKIEQMEKENLETKSWTMLGEITAAKRPKNSALEVNLDFDHKARPPPVITDEITASLEDLIRRRIIEGHFDDVQRAPALPLKASKELKELDEKKSQKGLAEIYEEEYAQKTGLAPVPLSSSDEQKKEVIEDMSVQVNVPALALEEIAPLAVSDSAMLAPEEVFQGKGDIKEASELTQAERKKKRANKKRKFKVETAKRAAKKPRGVLTVNKSIDL